MLEKLLQEMREEAGIEEASPGYYDKSAIASADRALGFISDIKDGANTLEKGLRLAKKSVYLGYPQGVVLEAGAKAVMLLLSRLGALAYMVANGDGHHGPVTKDTEGLLKKMQSALGIRILR